MDTITLLLDILIDGALIIYAGPGYCIIVMTLIHNPPPCIIYAGPAYCIIVCIAYYCWTQVLHDSVYCIIVLVTHVLSRLGGYASLAPDSESGSLFYLAPVLI